MNRLIIFILVFLPFTGQAQDGFELSSNSPHHLVVLPKAGWADMADMVGGFAKYSAKKYSEKELVIKQYRLTEEDKMPFVLISTFENEVDAIIYFQTLQKPLVPFLQMGVATDYFIISDENYQEVIRQKTFVDYQKYFKKEYPND